MVVLFSLFNGLYMGGWKNNLCGNNVSHFVVVTVISKDGELSNRLMLLDKMGAIVEPKSGWSTSFSSMSGWVGWGILENIEGVYSLAEAMHT